MLLVFNTGCEDYLDVNKNIDSPDYVDDYVYLSGILQAYQDRYNDILFIAPMIEMFGVTATKNASYANHYYVPADDAGALIWRTVYWNQGMNLENMINQAMAEERWTLVGIGYAVKAYSWDMLTKIYGEVPMKQALTYDKRTTFDYDSQEEVYTQVRVWAREAVKYLEMEDKTVYGSVISTNDWIYKGDKDKWKKFAYAVIVRNLSSLSNKTDFTAKYADELIDAAGKSFQSIADDATVAIAGGSQSVPYTGYNNFWGTARGNLTTTTFQHDYAVQVMTGTVPKYQSDGQRADVEKPANPYYPWQLMDDQIICDTAKTVTGHYDPRVVAKLSSTTNLYDYIDNADSVKTYKYYGGRNSTSRTNPVDSKDVPHLYGRVGTVQNGTMAQPNDGKGRWLYRDDAPYILTTYAEIKFCLAEAYLKKGQQDLAYTAFKEAVKADLAFTAKYLSPGVKGQQVGGDKVTVPVFNTLADEYANGPYVDGLGQDNLTLSHVMMQKWVSLYPWGAIEAWVDMRKYHYDIQYTGGYPTKGNGWEADRKIDQKNDNDPSKVYKGFYLGAARNIEFRNAVYDINNDGSPCYRIRPRYNSEYVWNIPSLEKLKPIAGTAPNYQCSIPWFAYPGDYPSK
jgi:hypothetical protein